MKPEIAKILDHFHITYRINNYSDGTFFFCCLPPPNKLTFDLFEKTDSVRLWRFIGTAPSSRIGTKWEHQKQPLEVTGLEVTAEGDICLYTELSIDENDPQKVKKISGAVDGFSKMIKRLKNIKI